MEPLAGEEDCSWEEHLREMNLDEKNSEIDKITHDVQTMYKPIEMQRSAIYNSRLMFKTAVGLAQEASFCSCFEVVREASSFRASGVELVSAADGPKKLSVAEDVWSGFSEDIRGAVRHFNAMLGTCHKFLGSKELRMVDIQLKLDELQLLSVTDERKNDVNKLICIPEKIEDFAREVETLLKDVSLAGRVFEFQITAVNSNGLNCNDS